MKIQMQTHIRGGYGKIIKLHLHTLFSSYLICESEKWVNILGRDDWGKKN